MIFLFTFSFVIVGCTPDAGLLSANEMRKLVSGVIVHGSQEENELAVKVCLELVSMCANMSNILGERLKADLLCPLHHGYL